MPTDLQEIQSEKYVSKKGAYHLSPDQINFLLAEFGQFKRPSHIISDFQNTFNRTVTDGAITQFQKRYVDEIKQVRDQWVNALADEAGSHKRVRVVTLWEMVCGLQDDLPQFKSNGEDKDYRLHIKQIESLLGSLRVEMEGNTLNINYRDLTTQKDDDLMNTARDVLNKVDPSMIEDANYKILVEDGSKEATEGKKDLNDSKDK